MPVPDPADQAADQAGEQTAPQSPSSPGGPPARELWRSPAGLSAIAAIAAVLVAVISLLVAELRRDAQSGTPSPSAGASVLFVYGTTMPGQSRHALIERYIDSSRPAEVNGFLYDTGAGYPAAKFDPTGPPIPGHLLTIRPDAVDELYQQMTQIEAGLYEPVEVIAVDGTRARGYEWIGPTDGLTRIDQWE